MIKTYLFLIIAIYPLTSGGELKYWSIILSLIFLILGILKSKILTPLNIAWLKFGIFLGKIISPIIMIYEKILKPKALSNYWQFP